jgi:hypothetical protein
MGTTATTTTSKKVLYWLTTVSAAFALAAIGAADLAGVPAVADGLRHLGYPAYVASMLGVWKLLGVAAILTPSLSRLKEWAYAGFFFVLTGAATSHAVSGDPIGKILVPLVVLVLIMASYALRPSREAVTTRTSLAPQAS